MQNICNLKKKNLKKNVLQDIAKYTSLLKTNILWMINTVGGIFHCWWDHSAFDSSLHLSTLTEKLRSSHWRCSVGKGVLRNFSKLQGNTCARVSFSIKLQAKAWYFIKKEAPTQMFSCEFCETSKNTFFTPFFDIFRGYRKRPVPLHGLRSIQNMYRYNSTKLRGTHEFWSCLFLLKFELIVFYKRVGP